MEEMEIRESGAINVSSTEQFNSTSFKQMIVEFSNNLVLNTSMFNNLRELKNGGEPIYYATFCMFRTIPKDENDKPIVCYEFGTATLASLEKIYNKKVKAGDKVIFTYYGYYKSNNLDNCKTVSNYYTLLYRLKSDIYVSNKKIDGIIFK